MKKLFLLITILFFSIHSIKSDNTDELLSIELSLNDTVYTIGDKISIKYKINYEKKLNLILPDLTHIFNNIELLNFYFDTASSELNLNLISFDTGSIQLPEIVFAFEDTTNNRILTQIAPTQQIQIHNYITSSNYLKEIPFIELPTTI